MLDPLGLELHVVKLPCGFWVPNSNPLQKQPVLVTTEISDQPLNSGFLISSLSLSLFILIVSCSLGYLYLVSEDSLKVLLPSSHKCWDYRPVLPCLAPSL